jgi:hypothetical protein
MNVIPIRPYPVEKGYTTFSAAIDGAKNHPLQKHAQADGDSLFGTTLTDGFWTHRDFVLTFSEEYYLHVFIADGAVRWSLTKSPPELQGDQIQRIGAPPVVLDFGGEVGETRADYSALLSQRQGASFSRLWVNEGGLLVYTRGHPILWFHPCYRLDTAQDVLFVFGEEAY